MYLQSLEYSLYFIFLKHHRRITEYYPGMGDSEEQLSAVL